MSGFDLNQLGNMAQGFLNNQGGNNNNSNNNNNNDNNNQQGGDNQQQQQQQHQGGGGGGFDIGQLAGLAQNFSSGNHDSSLFSQAASFVQNQGGNQNVDEQKLLQDHDEVNNQSGANTSGQIGNAAVLSALKSVLGGSGGQQQSGGGLQQKLMSAAMSHAADLFDQKDAQGQAQGNKQDAVNQAAQMAMGLAMKNPSLLAGLVGGGNSGGLGALAGLLK